MLRTALFNTHELFSKIYVLILLLYITDKHYFNNQWILLVGFKDDQCKLKESSYLISSEFK